MHHHEMIALAEQHRAELLEDAASARRRRTQRRIRKLRRTA